MATLVLGLPDQSRIKRKYQKRKITLQEELLALILDDLNSLLWALGKRHSKRPRSVYEILTSDPVEKDELMSFDSVEQYEAWRKAKEEQWSCQK